MSHPLPLNICKSWYVENLTMPKKKRKVFPYMKMNIPNLIRKDKWHCTFCPATGCVIDAMFWVIAVAEWHKSKSNSIVKKNHCLFTPSWDGCYQIKKKWKKQRVSDSVHYL